jgi:hypothetical protein
MEPAMKVKALFASDVTRDISPVVYFHEQSPEKLAVEVSEYIVTGGWPSDHPHHRRVPEGIHEQYVRLLTGIASELDKAGGPELPTAWISGFYGSGKSSFAKLLGLSLDGKRLPTGELLSEAWLRRDTSPRAGYLRDAWQRLMSRVAQPVAVVFDIGGVARDNEHIHAVAVRQVQARLGYCTTEPLVADFELSLERDGEWGRFEAVAQEVLGSPWATHKDKALAEEDFSLVMSVMYPDRYTDAMSWFMSRGGTHTRSESPEEAVAAIRDMIRFRKPDATLFLIIDEVSQYILTSKDRADRLRVFASALGAGLKGRAWLMALGQQKIDEEADDSFLLWVKDRFPPRLRVHLSATNIRDVVHKRLLQKRPDVEPALRDLFERHRADLKLFAYECEAITAEEFVEVYPMLPKQIDLILQLTTALRSRSTRSQGDDQAIRGLLQLLGELFRSQGLADLAVGALVTLDQIYEVQHTALDSDVQASMARVLSQCADDDKGLMVRAAKAVALLELIQEATPTTAKLVAQCLFDSIDRGNNLAEVTAALEALRQRNLLGYSEKHGYKLQSSAGEEWERERRDVFAPAEAVIDAIQDALKRLLADPERPKLHNRPFPLRCLFSGGRVKDAPLLDTRDEDAVVVDFQCLRREERGDAVWIRRSDEAAFRNRLIWLVGDDAAMSDSARELCRSKKMVEKYKPRRESLPPAKKILFQQEENRAEDLAARHRASVEAAWLAGRLYFRGLPIAPQDHGSRFAQILTAVTTRNLPELFPHFVPIQVAPAELAQLLDAELSGISQKFLKSDVGLGIFDLDGGRYVPVCTGQIPQQIQDFIKREGGVGGTGLLAEFSAPPYGYAANVVKASVAGLLRAGLVRLQPDGSPEITAFRDVGVKDVFDKDRNFRRATTYPAGDDDIGVPARAKICKLFKERLNADLDREDHAIADAVSQHFPRLVQRLRTVTDRLDQIKVSPPDKLKKLGVVLEQCIGTARQTKPVVKLVKKHLDALRDGIDLLNMYDAELTPDALRAVRLAADVLHYQITQLQDAGLRASNIDDAAARLTEQLASERPWREIGALDPDITDACAAYAAERTRLLQWQEQLADDARSRIKARDGFPGLKGEQTHKVLRPITAALSDTTADAIAPALRDLKDPFLLALKRAEDHANDTLDDLLTPESQPKIARVDLKLRNRELASPSDIDALLSEVKTRLLDELKHAGRIRLL